MWNFTDLKTRNPNASREEECATNRAATGIFAQF
jgi:hypothetical protein